MGGVLNLVLNAIPLIQFSIFFLALFYTLQIKMTFRNMLFCVFLIFLPSIAFLFLDLKQVVIIYLAISTLVFFSFATKSLRAFIDFCCLVFGGIISEQIAYKLYFLMDLSQPKSSYIFYAIIIVAFLTFTYYYKKFILRMHPTVAFSSNAKVFIIFVSFLTIFLMYLNFLLPLFGLNEQVKLKIHLVIEVICFSSMFVLYRTSTKEFKIKNNLDRLERENIQHINYMKSLETINKEMQKFKHDYSNILLTIQGYLETENLQGLKQYFKSHILKAEQSTFFKNEAFSNLDNLKVVELKGLLSTKVVQANQLGIRLHVEIPETIDSIEMDIIDLTRIIGILTDNAIEACSTHDDAQISISFMKTNHNTILICIDNTIDEFKIHLDDIYKENFSTKGKNRGIGLTNVKDILKNYDNIDLTTQVEDGWFMQELEIPVKELALTV